MTEKPIAVMLPSWDPDEPRFIVTECEQCSDDRKFANGMCVYNQRLGFAYSVDETVEVLNALGSSLEDKTVIRRLYLDVKNNVDNDEVFRKEDILKILGYIAEVLEVDLKEYKKISLKELLDD